MPPFNILSGHNFYQQDGGEDRVFAAEAALLERHGHTVVRYEDRNDRIHNGVGAAIVGIWNQSSRRRLQSLVRSHALEVAHFHNTFPLISPSAYYAVRSQGAAVVQTVHNFRLLCPGATLLRQGAVCEDCLRGRSVLPAVVHGCYRNSRPATAALATMLVTHRIAGTWRNQVDAYIAVSGFARRKLIEGGLPTSRVFVKPNFVASAPTPGEGGGNYALFVGRLSEEKGIRVLADAWRKLSGTPLMVAGDGPLRDTSWPADVTYLGAQAHGRVIELMRNAQLLIFPSICYECAPMVIVEALACGLPVIASNLGSIPEFVDHRRTGLLFNPGDAEDLTRQVRWAFDHPLEIRAMRAAARREFETKYTAEHNYKLLMDIYEMAIENARRRRRAAS